MAQVTSHDGLNSTTALSEYDDILVRIHAERRRDRLFQLSTPKLGTATIEDNLSTLSGNSLVSRGPLVFVLMVMIIVGTSVNFVVTVVFLKRFPASALRSYMVTMSISDFVACSIAIPFHIYTIAESYNFPCALHCKVYFTVMSLSTNCSSFIVVLFSMDRFRRVCKPVFKELDTIRSYYQIAGVVFLALAVTIPFIPLYGLAYQTVTVESTVEGKLETSKWTVRMCWIDDSYKDTIYPYAYEAVLISVFCVGLAIIVGFYYKIWIKINRLTTNLKLEALPPQHLQASQVGLAEGSALVEPCGQERPGGPIPFAERLHAPRIAAPHARAATLETPTTRIKKLSSTLQRIFTPEPLPAVNSSDSSFISNRADTTFMKSKTITKILSSHSWKLPTLSPRWSEVPDDQSEMSVRTLDTVRLESSADDASSASSVKFAQLNQNNSALGELPQAGPSDKIPQKQESKVLTRRSGTAVSGNNGVNPVKKAVSTSSQKAPKHSESALKAETLETLQQLEFIKNKCTLMMIVLTLFYIITWLPNLFARFKSERPANLCVAHDQCWLNGPSYSICSVYISSTFNAFFYCFGSVHFRKQMKLCFAPFKIKICRRQRRKVVRRPVKKESNPQPEDMAKLPVPQEPAEPPLRKDDPYVTDSKPLLVAMKITAPSEPNVAAAAPQQGQSTAM